MLSQPIRETGSCCSSFGCRTFLGDKLSAFFPDQLFRDGFEKGKRMFSIMLEFKGLKKRDVVKLRDLDV